MTTALRSPLIEDTARAIYAHVVTKRRYQSPVGFNELDYRAQEIYRGMAQAALAAIRGHTLTFAPLNLRERIRAAWKRFLERHWACEYRGPGSI